MEEIESVALIAFPALHSYAFDCITHHLFHPYGSNSLQMKSDEEIMKEVTFDSSLQSKPYTRNFDKLLVLIESSRPLDPALQPCSAQSGR